MLANRPPHKVEVAMTRESLRTHLVEYDSRILHAVKSVIVRHGGPHKVYGLLYRCPTCHDGQHTLAYGLPSLCLYALF